MNSIGLPQVWRVILPLFLYSHISASHAALDKFRPYAFTRAVYDSNLFRVSGKQEAVDVLGSDKRDDRIYYLGAGIDADLKVSRQHFLLDAQVQQALYDTYDQLDHVAALGTATWAWRVGNVFSGDLGYDYRRELRSFNEDSRPVKDIRTRNQGFFRGGYQIHPDWELIAGLTVTDVGYDERTDLDRQANSGLFEVQYKNTLNSRVGLRVQLTANDLNDQVINGIVVSNDYDELNYSGVFYWEGSSKSSFEARVGYTDQRFDELSGRDFQGYTGRLAYNWKFSGKTKIDFAIWRETSTLNDEISNYVLSTGASVNPRWAITPLISLLGLISYENNDYKGNSSLAASLGGEQRKDDLWVYRIGARWQARRYLDLYFGFRNASRDSNIDRNDFDDNQAEARLDFSF